VKRVTSVAPATPAVNVVHGAYATTAVAAAVPNAAVVVCALGAALLYAAAKIFIQLIWSGNAAELRLSMSIALSQSVPRSLTGARATLAPLGKLLVGTIARSTIASAKSSETRETADAVEAFDEIEEDDDEDEEDDDEDEEDDDDEGDEEDDNDDWEELGSSGTLLSTFKIISSIFNAFPVLSFTISCILLIISVTTSIECLPV